jgi:DNA mismatch endonuclease (patch repair protein)
VDKVSPEERSRIMRAVRKQDTGPEMIVRRLLHAAGYRYRLHDRRLPGSPDLVFSKRCKAVFVHGCFWHGHKCRASLTPSSRQDYWLTKLARNRARDKANTHALEANGWSVLTVWECETRNKHCTLLERKLISFLGPQTAF